MRPLDVSDVDKGTDQRIRGVVENQSERARQKAGKPRRPTGVIGGWVLCPLLDRERPPVRAPPDHGRRTEADVTGSVQPAEVREPLSGILGGVERENDDLLDLLERPVVSARSGRLPDPFDHLRFRTVGRRLGNHLLRLGERVGDRDHPVEAGDGEQAANAGRVAADGHAGPRLS